MDEPQPKPYVRGSVEPHVPTVQGVAGWHEDRRRQIEILRDALGDVQRAKAFAMLPRVVQDKVRAARRWKP
jgi:hypothetical protein